MPSAGKFKVLVFNKVFNMVISAPVLRVTFIFKTEDKLFAGMYDVTP
jgi:hypothetical protein